MVARRLGVLSGVATAGVVTALSRGETLVPWPDRVRTLFPFAVGAVGGAAVGTAVGTVAATTLAVTTKGKSVDNAGSSSWIPALSIAGAAAGAVVAGQIGISRLIASLMEQSRGLDEGFAVAPSNPLVSGGPESLVALTELGREGARFVGSVTTADDSEYVTGTARAAEPIRVFIGVDAASSVEQRVGLAMAELRRTGAFDRKYLLIEAPAGSGFANPTPVDILEILSGGDCAVVAIGYGLLPSFLSLGKVELAARTQRLLLDAIHEELSEAAHRPTLLLYGESLGARVQEAAVNAGPADLDYYGISHALWVGTPGGVASDQFHELCAGESITVDRPEQIPVAFAGARPRVWFLEHDGDPVVRFRPDLAHRRPTWLSDGPRGRHVPTSMGWKPGITWAQVLIDTLFATNVKPGDFQSMGHDYRADLGQVVAAAFELPLEGDAVLRLDDRLRQIEIDRAQRIAAE